jgi:transposase-like protein
VEFYPTVLERGERSERALKLAVAEMYVQGVSTRKVAAITQELCGLEVSSVQVSRAAVLLDEELHAWRSRALGETPYLILDARYEKIRHGGSVRDCAVLILQR